MPTPLTQPIRSRPVELRLTPEIPAEESRVDETPAEKPRDAFGEVGGVGTLFFSGYLTGEEYNTDLQGQQGIKVYDQMWRSDGDVKAMIRACSLPLMEADWMISPVDESEDQVAVAQFVEDNLMNGMTHTWRFFLHHVLLAYRYGHQVFEVVWAPPNDDDGKIRLKKLAPRLSKTIWRWWPNENDDLDRIEQRVWKYDVEGQGKGKYEIIEIPASKLLVFTLDQEGNNYEGVSLLRAAYKHWYMKETFYKIDGIANERHGVGVPVFSEPQGALVSERNKAARILAGLHANEKGYILEPFGWKFRFENPGGSSVKEMMPSIEHHSTMMLRSILAQFLTSTEVGSYARSRVDSSLFLQALQSMGSYICEVINKLIRQLVDYNFTVKRYPVLIMGELDKSRVVEYLKDIPVLVEKGIITLNPELETSVRKAIGLPDYTPTPEEIEARQAAGLPGEGVDTDSQGEEAEEDEGGEELAHLHAGHTNQKAHGRGGGYSLGDPSGGMDDVVDEWATGGMTSLRDASLKVQSGKGKKSNPQHVKAAALLDEVESGPVVPVMYRGLAVSKGSAVFEVGGEVALPLSSFSKSKVKAGGFSDLSNTVQGRDQKVIYELRGARGFDVSKHPVVRKYGMSDQQEVITAGKFKVSRVSEEQGRTHVVLEPIEQQLSQLNEGGEDFDEFSMLHAGHANQKVHGHKATSGVAGVDEEGSYTNSFTPEEKTRALSALEQVKDAAPGDTWGKNEILISDVWGRDQIGSVYPEPKTGKRSKVTEIKRVSISELTQCQPGVPREGVKSSISAGRTTDTSIPFAVQIRGGPRDGRIYIQSGHTRVTAAKLAGRDHVLLEVGHWDVNAPSKYGGGDYVPVEGQLSYGESEDLAQPSDFERTPSFLEGAVNFAQLNADFDYGISELSNRTQTVLRQQAEAAVDAAIKVQSRGDVVDPGKIDIPYTAKLRDAILVVMTQVAERGQKQVREEAERQGVRTEAKMIFGIDTEEDLLQSLEIRSKIIASAMTTRLRGTLSMWFSSIFPRRQSRDDLVEELVQKLNREMLDQSGVVVNDSLNLGRVLQAQMIGSPKAQYSALLDKNTCTPCFQLDGEEFETDSEQYLKYMPPYSECKGRRRCRCIYVWDFIGEGDA